jgi:hypothetical protein
MASRLVGHVVRRQSAKFFIDQRQQFLSGFGIALLDALEDLGDIAHMAQSSAVVRRDNFKRLGQQRRTHFGDSPLDASNVRKSSNLHPDAERGSVFPALRLQSHPAALR